ncbi:uncharacterized protein LOC123549863 [Mercenaria mercenaria]|uniref:uncharacterized protein LOC123549863 n=1 Tax=Mercenaria mercenaria TaxID=6596 RepID=UPI00234F7570|nr:uncharacterized protein LOC123549863 [Mercenaria mercenaria]
MKESKRPEIQQNLVDTVEISSSKEESISSPHSIQDSETKENVSNKTQTEASRIGQLGNQGSKFDNGLFVNGYIDNTPVDFLIDSGSTATLISKSVFDKLGNQTLQVGSTQIQGVDGSQIKVFGRDNFVIRLGDVSIEHKVIVCDMAMDGIIGQDYILKHVKYWDLDNLQLKLRSGQSIQCITKGEAERVCRIIVSEKVELPPNSYSYIKFVSLIEGVVDPHANEIGVGVINTDDEPTVLNPGLGLGFCKSSYEECEDEVISCANINEGSPVDSKNAVVPEHLTELFKKSSIHLKQDEKFHLASLLNKYENIFVTSSDELGCTDRVKHKIYTGDAHPVKQAPRRQPIGKRSSEKEEVIRMLKKGIIEPSNSEWSSPVVLITKKDGSTRFCVDYRKLNAVTKVDAY